MSESYVDSWLPEGEMVNFLSASVAHHHATGHPGGSAGLEDYQCDECDFEIIAGQVVYGGLIRTKPGATK